MQCDVDRGRPTRVVRKHCHVIHGVTRNNVTAICRTVSRHLKHAITVGIVRARLTGNPRQRRFIRQFHHRTGSTTSVTGPRVIRICSANRFGKLSFLIVRCIRNIGLQRRVGTRNAFSIHRALHIITRALSNLTSTRHTNIIRHSVGPRGVLVGSHNRIRVASFNLTGTTDRTALDSANVLLNATTCLTPRVVRGGRTATRNSLCSINVVT